MDSKKKNPHKQGQITQEMQEILNHQLRDGEYVLAQFKPEKRALVRCAILGASSIPLPFVLLWMVVGFGVTIGVGISEPMMLLFIIPFMAVWMAPVWIWLGGVILASTRYPYIHYAMTNMRFLCRQRKMDRRFRTIPYEQIRRIFVRNKAFGKFQKITIEVNGMQSYFISGLSNGHEIYDMLDRALHEFREMNPHLANQSFGWGGFGGFGRGFNNNNMNNMAPMQRATHCQNCGGAIEQGGRGFCVHCGGKVQTWRR